MPGVFSGIGGIVCAGIATTELYGRTSVLSSQYNETVDMRRSLEAACFFSF